MKIIDWIKSNKILLAIAFIGALFRFYKLDFQSLWIDEIFTVNIADPKYDFQFIYAFLRDHDPHPPLYYFLVHIFFLLFGYTTLVLKLFSAILGILGIFSIFYAGKELITKKVGLIAAFLTSINYFQIYYSQEGRMYSLLFFTTCIALYTLIKFLKKPNYKTMILFVIGSSLMIYSQFFGVFVLISFYFILLYFIFKDGKNQLFKRLKLSVFAGLITTILYIPAIIIVLLNPKRDSIWIQLPTWDTYEMMFKEFFGFNSILNIIIIVVFIASIVLSFIGYKKGINKKDGRVIINPVLLLLLLIVITIIFPLIYSYVLLPIVVSRYYICILPMVIILLAMAISTFKNKYLQIAVLLLFSFFSIKNLIYDKKFYSSYYKTQFSHAIIYMVQKHANETIVARLGGFYLNYYLNQNNYYKPVIENDINGYVTSIKADTLHLKSFWYFDGHTPVFKPTHETKAFLEKNYFLDESVEYFDAFVKHYVIKSDYKPTVDLSSFIPFQEKNGDNINFYIEKFEEKSNQITISGWAYFLDQSSESTKIQLLAIKDNENRIILSENVKRDDVTSYFKSSYDISNCGFNATFSKSDFNKGTYVLALYIIDTKNNKKGLFLTDKNFSFE
ncbi:glycosyltransferase family 39 protein [Flavobacterium sp.]|uniref:glycosyltransferase family 39 protein n=1 Tax=Flavobacterium sp. TaxID=239 RepID=UPI0025D72924|nr:glycosyltransferase family 39 protein [Flavobacterium sp.]